MQFSIHIIRTVINTGNDPDDQNKSTTNKHKGKSAYPTKNSMRYEDNGFELIQTYESK